MASEISQLGWRFRSRRHLFRLLSGKLFLHRGEFFAHPGQVLFLLPVRRRFYDRAGCRGMPIGHINLPWCA